MGFNVKKHFATPYGVCKFCKQPVFPGSVVTCGDEVWHPQCDPRDWAPLTETDKAEIEGSVASSREGVWFPPAYCSRSDGLDDNPNFRQKEKFYLKRIYEAWAEDKDWKKRAYAHIEAHPEDRPGWMRPPSK